MGDDVKNWPEQSDPATIAVYACRQREVPSLPANQRGVFYRLVMRENVRGKIPVGRMYGQNYIDTNGDQFLNQVEHDLRGKSDLGQKGKVSKVACFRWYGRRPKFSC